MRIWGQPPLSRLSEREREFYVLFLCGHDAKEIAARMEISASRVSRIKSQLMGKLGITTDIRLVLFGVRMGLLDEDGTPTRSDGNLLPLTPEELTG